MRRGVSSSDPGAHTLVLRTQIRQRGPPTLGRVPEFGSRLPRNVPVPVPVPDPRRVRYCRRVPAATAWNARFFEQDARFWPIAPAARAFAEHADFPAPEELVAPGVRFVSARKPRRARRQSAPDVAYDARILRGEVP